MTSLADPGFVRLGEALQRRHRPKGVHRAWERLRRTAATVACAVPPVRDRVPALAGLPRLAIGFSASPGGRRMADKYSGVRNGVPRRLAVSVLALPETPADYLRGRSRQALRTNSRRARESGVSCRRAGRAEAEARVAALLSARGEQELLPEVRADLASGLVEAWVACDAHGVTEVLALTSSDGGFARLDLMLSAPEREAGPARYLLSAHLIGEHVERGVRHLAVDTALWLDGGLRHFQRLLGFEPTTLAVTRDGPVHRPSPAIARPVGIAC